jgi:predicted phage terminase large subunit-like protein
MNESEKLLQIYRTDYAAFAQRAFYELYPDERLDWNWHHDLIVDRLLAMRRGENRRQLVLVPPRSFKSFLCSVAWPAFLLGHQPSMKIICASYGQSLATDLAKLGLDLMKSDFYRQVFPTRLKHGQQSVDNFYTTRGGFRKTASQSGPLTGRGADLIIIDDPMKADDVLSETLREGNLTWFRNTLRSRLNQMATGQILVVMQRLHQDDLAGMLIEQDWPMLRLPAIATEDEEHHYSTLLGPVIKHRREGETLHPERDPPEVFEEIRRDMGAFSYAAQFLLAPEPEEGNIIRRDWISGYARYELPEFSQKFQSWDTASKTEEFNDFSVCTTWGVAADRRIFLLHVLRKRLTYPDLKRAVIEQAELHGPDTVLIEDQASGISLLQDLFNDGFYKAKAVKTKGSKAERLRGVSGMFENGFVLGPSEAPWRDAYVSELINFPGKFDDQVDSSTQALLYIREFGMEPGIITYYREEVEAMRRQNEDPIVKMRSPGKVCCQVQINNGLTISTDAEGYIMVTEVVARPLRLAGWEMISMG